MTGLCVAAAGLAVHIAASSFTLSWTHTVEKTLWEEEWRIEEGGLVLARARVKGSGAGMEPPAAARLEHGFYVWEPDERRASIVLRNDPHAGDWTLCAGGGCAALREWLGGDADPVRLSPATRRGCEAPAGFF